MTHAKQEQQTKDGPELTAKILKASSRVGVRYSGVISGNVHTDLLKAKRCYPG